MKAKKKKREREWLMKQIFLITLAKLTKKLPGLTKKKESRQTKLERKGVIRTDST